MIKMEINKHVTSIEASGNIPDITSELLVGIKVFKEKFDANDVGDAFIDALKAGLDLITAIDDDDFDVDEVLEEKIEELVDKAIKDDMFLDRIMDRLPDELKSDFAKRLKKKAGEQK